MRATLVERLLAALPQTQCTRCGYPDCAGYAQALASGTTAINRCPPGGQEGIERLARLLGQPVLALDPACGSEAPRGVAVIDEDWCIGCTLCIKVCPTDAIVGANKLMHTVLERYCTGCELCLAACPVDCIAMENASGTATGWTAWSAAQAQQARERYEIRSKRLLRDTARKAPELDDETSAANPTAKPQPLQLTPDNTEHKRQAMQAALQRARHKRLQPPPES